MGFLLLSRSHGEAIRISDDIEVVVMDVRGGQVKLGIKAPHHIPVHREEVYQRIQLENGSQKTPVE